MTSPTSLLIEIAFVETLDGPARESMSAAEYTERLKAFAAGVRFGLEFWEKSNERLKQSTSHIPRGERTEREAFDVG